MSVRAVVVASLIALPPAGCEGTAVRLEIRGNYAVPEDIDALCVSIAGTSATGEAETFHGLYDADDLREGLPQTIVVTPGSSSEAQVWVRARKAGIEVARVGALVTFADKQVTDVPLDLGTCPSTSGLAPMVVDSDDGIGEVKVVAALGWRAPVLLAVGPSVARRFHAAGGQLEALDGGVPETIPAALPDALVPIDVDGDCDDDVVIAAPGAPPEIWLQGPDGAFSAGATLPVGATRAVAGADVNGDGRVDLAVGGADGASILVGGGQGQFTEDGEALVGDLPGDVTALSFGDTSGDGAPELVVGQGSTTAAPSVLFLSEGGSLVRTDAALAPVALLTRGLELTDVNGDRRSDLVVAATGSRVRLYVNRGGLLEDRSFLLLPSTDPVDAVALSVADLDGDCLADIAVGLEGAPPLLWRATPTGAFQEVTLEAAAQGTYPVLADADGDGVRDLLIGGTAGVVWAEP